MKRITLSLIALLAVFLSYAQTWENAVTGYADNSVFNVKKVWLLADRTELHLHIRFMPGKAININPATRLQVGNKEYKLVGKETGGVNAFPGTVVFEYGKPFFLQDGEADVILAFEPLPADTKDFNLLGGDGWASYKIRNGAQLPAGITDTYWRDDATGEWLVGFGKTQVVYDCRFWEIESIDQKKDRYILTATNNGESVRIAIDKMKKGVRKIAINGAVPVKCSPITTATLPDYPVKDTRVGFKDNGYALGDSVTIVGWLKDMPAEALQRGGNEFNVDVHNIITRNFEDESFYDKMDSLGRFTIKMPLMNTSQVYMDWKRTTEVSVLEPEETYFFLYDFGTGQKLFMGSDARLQNELLAYPASSMYERMEHHNATQEQTLEFLNHVKSCGERNNRELQKRVEEHPMLSRRYIDYLTGCNLVGMGESLMQGKFSVAGDKLPAEYIAFADSVWSSLITPLSTDGFSTLSLPKSIYRDYTTFMNDYMSYKQDNMHGDNSIASRLKKLADDGKISLNEKEYDAASRFDGEVEHLKSVIANVPDDEKKRLVMEFNNSDISKTVSNIAGRSMAVIQYEYILEEAEHSMSRVQNNKELYDIYMAGILYNSIDNLRTPLPANIIEWAENNLKLPAAKQIVAEMQGKYLALASGRFSSSSIKQATDVENMSDGEKILRKLIEPYKGKIILVDVWGTWCSPCRQALSHSKELYEKMAQYDIVFLYLANCSDEESWKNIIKEYNVTGENVVHYNLPAEQQSAVENFLRVSGYPTYRLIDRNGNVLDVNADPRNFNGFENLIKAM